MAAADKPWGRRLIVCCDGTWQSSVTDKENVPSNVTKLCRVLDRFGTDRKNPGKKWHQIVYYDSGIGTGNLSGTESTRQGGTGAGLAENVIEAYNFIVLNYEEGDEICCFGFSRGAYTARAVAGLVTDIGVIQPLEMQFFPQVYRAYMNNHDGRTRFKDSDPWKKLVGELPSEKGQPIIKFKPNDESREIKVIGVWDTVGSLGVPDIGPFNNGGLRAKFGFHNVKLSGHVKHAYHALALDERRAAFRPTLWYIDPKSVPKPELKQVWFPGVHINCGGGSDDGFSKMEGDMENISVATFTWMLQCIAPHLDIKQQAFDDYMNQYTSWLTNVRYRCTYQHPQTEDWSTWLKKKLPDVPLITLGTPTDPLTPPKRAEKHEHTTFDFGWGVGPILDSFNKLYLANGTYPRQPGHEMMEVNGAWIPIKGIKGDEEHPLTGYETNEFIHPLVHYRRSVRLARGDAEWDEWTYHGTAHPLAKWKREHKRGDERFWWHKVVEDDPAEPRWLPEWVILPHGTQRNFERSWYETAQELGRKLSTAHAARDKGKVEYLTGLDREIGFEVGSKLQNEWP
ncbi:hypothetical protein EKO04_002472 [Ascochyta lentis]|uniref:T6SS Phospholipase effector Tle1-like catalytic domain-containing protein n=1 Tax=Ascochyta lentis TaxID=205686 RepID=A0A8H7MG32_9PLEO|nr:hypothetical protein EKO04_002472 [Ascochyta lentis]